uniref:Proteasome assembly chaperone 1 n=1 Tax=Riptortus pedestris TaxID=329032 RepID=R4WIN0_RIPPE|nr:unkown protein [Riptortus pedestris]
MATFFGEVILPSSRAFFDDLDDSDNDDAELLDKFKPKLVLNYQEKDLMDHNYDALIISEGAVAKGFTQNYMISKESKLVAEVNLEKESEDNFSDVFILNPRKVESTKLYLLGNNCLLLQLSENIDLGLANQLTVLIHPILNKCQRIITLVSRHNSDFRCDSVNDLPLAFVRALATSGQALPPPLKHLEQPNFISNVSASVIGWCEASNRAGLMLILYSDQMTLDAFTLAPLSKAFSETGLSKYIINKQPVLSSTDPLKNLDKSFMYM